MTETLAAGSQTGTDAVPAIRLRKLTKVFGDTVAVNGVDLDIRQGEFFSMLGPSGSGKTTVLRLIAGFELPTAGSIELEGKDVTGMAPFERDLNTVFQDYALFPHMSLVDNVAYGLRVRGVSRKERHERARDALERVQLGKFVSRKPAQLSGGQRQRVALARALVVKPKVLLLDEPLGALDLKLRQQMQVELKELQRSLGITFIFVTHDQEEALTMSDRIGVFNNGSLRADRHGPRDLRAPRRDVRGQLRRHLQHLRRRPRPADSTAAPSRLHSGRSGCAWPGRRRRSRAPASRPGTGTVTSLVYVGHATQVRVQLDDGPAVVVLVPETLPGGDAELLDRRVTVSWDDDDAVWLPPDAP